MIYLKRMDASNMAIFQKISGNQADLYRLSHVINPYKPGVHGQENDWRMYKLYRATIDPIGSGGPHAASSYDLTKPGNWEHAFQITDLTKPLIGGMHGYEISTGLIIYADGKQVGLTAGSPLVKAVNTLEIAQHSNMLNPSNINNIVAQVRTSWLFDGTKLTIGKTYDWKTTSKIVKFYAGMFPTSIADNVSHYGALGSYPAVELLNRDTIEHRNVNYGTVWGLNNQFRLKMTVTQGLNNYLNNGTDKSWIRSYGDYNKLYILRTSTPGYEIVKNGDRWSTKAVYETLR